MEMRYECIGCQIKFKAIKKREGYIPVCPKCYADYRVFELAEDTNKC